MSYRRTCSSIWSGKAAFLSSVVLLIFLRAVIPVFGSSETPKKKMEEKPDDLGERLIRKAITDADEDPMEKISRLMGESSRKLAINFDAGDETQAIQNSILEQLNEVIKKAASRRRLKSSARQQWRAEKRRRPKKADDLENDKEGKARKAQGGPEEARTTGVASGEESSPEGELMEPRRVWGNLPLRDRDEIIQGIGEQYLERYREWIERYYRALQEADE